MRVPVAVMAGLPANCYTLLYFTLQPVRIEKRDFYLLPLKIAPCDVLCILLDFSLTPVSSTATASSLMMLILMSTV